MPARPLAASLRVPSPPSTTTASVPRAAAPWASRVACPRRLVSATVTSWSAASDFWITTRARAVTDEAEALTIRRSRTSAVRARARFELLGERAQLGHAAVEQARDLHLGDARRRAISDWVRPSKNRRCDDLPLARQLARSGGVAAASARPRSEHLVSPGRSDPAAGLRRLAVGSGGVEGGEPVGLAGLERLEHLLLGDLHLGGQLGDGR